MVSVTIVKMINMGGVSDLRRGCRFLTDVTIRISNNKIIKSLLRVSNTFLLLKHFSFIENTESSRFQIYKLILRA